DEMGLGKTLLVIALIAVAKSEREQKGSKETIVKTKNESRLTVERVMLQFVVCFLKRVGA
ncbi:hypothetical protein KIN20_035395, partial [Parelaphostrongylus tenuis]